MSVYFLQSFIWACSQSLWLWNKSEVQCSNGLLVNDNKNISTNFEPFFPLCFLSNSGIFQSLKLDRPKFYEKLRIPSFFVHIQWSYGLQGSLAVICICQSILFYSLWLFCAARQVCALCTKLCPLDIIRVSKKHGEWDPDRLINDHEEGNSLLGSLWNVWLILFYIHWESVVFPSQKMQKARFKVQITLDIILSEEWWMALPLCLDSLRSKAVKIGGAVKLKKVCS